MGMGQSVKSVVRTETGQMYGGCGQAPCHLQSGKRWRIVSRQVEGLTRARRGRSTIGDGEQRTHRCRRRHQRLGI
jgi:hypothetical protein